MLIKDKRVENIIRKNSIRPHRFANSINAFWIGGLFGAIGQGLYILYSQIMKFSVNDSSMLVSLTLIFLVSFLPQLEHLIILQDLVEQEVLFQL